MSTIEERVVSMKFQGDQFLAGIDQSLQKLENFNTKLKMTEGTKGLDGVGAAAQRQSGALSRIAEGVQSISDRFKSMSVIGIATLTNITNQAVFAGEQLVKSLTIAPVIDGFHEYETNLNSIQTILGNTQAAGTKLTDVTAVLDDLNHYSDQTIYNFAEMAKNIGTFTAAGVALKPAAQAIKGIANLAALSGSNSAQASAAMYQLSQAISSGRVSLEDWNSVVNAGMGGTVFQRALALNAEKMGTLSKGAVKLTGDMKTVTIAGKSFRDSITAKAGQKSWLTSEVLTRTLAQFTGDLSAATLKAQGFNDAEIKAIQSQAKMAQNAATEVKTLTQLIDTAKESVGSGWAQTWKIIFGDFEGAKKLFTNVNNVLSGFISASSDARNKVLEDWAKMGGRAALIEGIGNAFKALVSVIKPIREAFREVFPPTTAQQLAWISFTIQNFTKNLSVSGSTANKIKRIFAGVFSVFGIGWDIIKQVAAMFGRLFGVLTNGNGHFLELAARFGDFLVKLRQSIRDGRGLESLFKGLGNVLSIPLKAIQAFGEALGVAFDRVDGGRLAKNIESVSAKLNPLAKMGDITSGSWNNLVDILENILTKFFKLGDWVGSHMGEIGSKIADAFSGMNFSDITKGINTGLFAGLVVMLKRFLGGGNSKGGFLDNIKESIESLTGTLKAMQTALKAAALLQIALAIGVLAVSLNVLSKVDASGLARGTVAMAGLFSQLVGASILLDKFSSFKGAAKLPFIAGSMILMGAAVYILASAMQKLASMNWESLAKGLTGVTVLFAEMVAMTKLMPNSTTLIATAASMVIMSIGIKTIASAVQTLGSMSWEDMARGLVGVGILMAGLATFANTTNLNLKGVISGVVIIMMAQAIQTLANALLNVSKLGWDEMARGLTVTAAGLGIIAGALRIIPPASILSAAAIFIAAQALSTINDVFAKGAGMSWDQIGKGMTVMAGSLIILATALRLMKDTLPGAGALAIAAGSLQLLSVSLAANANLSWEQIAKGMVVIAGSLLLLTVAMKAMEKNMTGAQALITAAGALGVIGATMAILGNLSWTQVAIGLVALAGVFAVLGVAGLLLEPVIPAILSLAISVAMIGVAMLAAGAGIALFGLGVMLLAAGLAAIAVSGVAAATAIVGMIGVLLGGVPMIIQLVGEILAGLLLLIIKLTPLIGLAFMGIMLTIINVVKTVSPKITDLILFLLTTLVEKLSEYVPKIADAGLRMITALLNVWANRIGAVVDAATNLIVAFLNGLSRNMPKINSAATNLIITFINEIGKNALKIADAGMKMIVNFVNGLADSIRNNAKAMREAGHNLAMAIVDGMTGGLASGVSDIIAKAENLGSWALTAIKNILGVKSPSKEFKKIGVFSGQGLVDGLDASRIRVEKASAMMGKKAIESLRGALSEVPDILNNIDTRPIIRPVLDLSDIRKNAGQIGHLFNGAHIISTLEPYSDAKYASAGFNYNKNIGGDIRELVPSTSDITFIQNNTSPKALSPGDIYRQTKNQLSVAKRELTNA